MGCDNSNKPILKPNTDAKYIQEAFQLIASGIYNQKEILTLLKSKGLKTSKTALSRIIRNLLYCGVFLLKPLKAKKK